MLYYNYEDITVEVLNKVVSNQKVLITESELERLKKIPGVKFDLPLNDETYPSFETLVGKPNARGYKSGIYIFTHLPTGSKYVGSSNSLSRRLDQYLTFKHINQKNSGQLLPLMKTEGFDKFSLEIFIMPIEFSSGFYYLFLEQYYLLNREFNLNTLKVVNAGSSKGDGVYIYNLTCSALLYHAKSRIELKRVLKIHPESCKIYIDSKFPYLNKFILLSFPIPTASTSNISIKNLIDIMQRERQNTYILGTRRSIPVELEIKEGNTFIDSWGQTLNFDSLTSCIEYLRGLGLTIKRDTLTKYIKIEKVFHNFLCKYSDKNLPKNFEEIGLIMDEYIKFKEDTNLNSFKFNKKNKPILVKGVVRNDGMGRLDSLLEKKFDNITDTRKYFETLDIKLDRKTLYIRLKDGKIYKNYYFTYIVSS